MIEARDFAALREVFREWPHADVAEVLLDLPEDEQVIIFRVLPHDLAVDVFGIAPTQRASSGSFQESHAVQMSACS